MTVDPTRCPVCGDANACATERRKVTGETDGGCWCVAVEFRAEVLDRIPEEARMKACVCAGCATTA